MISAGDHERRITRAVHIGTSQKHRERAQHHGAAEPRHQEQSTCARIDKTALFEQPTVFFRDDLTAERRIEPANPRMRENVREALSRLWVAPLSARVGPTAWYRFA